MLTGNFEPLSLSLDEASGTYLIVRENDHLALWRLNEEGERFFSYALAPGTQTGFIPPVVGYDHRVYLLTTEHVIALGPAGETLWKRTVVGKAGGAAVTVDGHLLLTAGPQLSAYDAEGRRAILANFGEDLLSTPPGLTEKGDLLVASNRYLYCLTQPVRR
jgi:hypothetical protein